ncbi:TlpA family protein disulfide reductase [Patescibacteria group bacterium]
MGDRILFLLLILTAIFVVAGCNFPTFNFESDTEQVTESLNKPATDFELKDLEGNLIKLSDYSTKGGSASGGKNQKVVVIIFGATWCPPCQQELPEVQEYYQNTDKEKLEIIWIHNNEKENTIKNFRDEHGLEFPIVNDQNGKVYDQYKISSIPATVFVDKQGGIAEIKVGAMNKESLEKKVRELIEE